ncbi:unnamed protein product, partial [marine sediment metagenome]
KKQYNETRKKAENPRLRRGEAFQLEGSLL